LIRYPIEVHISGRRRTVGNAQELISQYDSIFSPAYRKAVADSMPRNMFARDQGIMLGRGEAWFGSDGRVIALNNYLTVTPLVDEAHVTAIPAGE
jgi:hypothetical protein